jgi:hypothetical protein
MKSRYTKIETDPVREQENYDEIEFDKHGYAKGKNKL